MFYLPGWQRRSTSAPAAGRTMGAGRYGVAWHQMRRPLPARCLHAHHLLQAVDAEHRWRALVHLVSSRSSSSFIITLCEHARRMLQTTYYIWSQRAVALYPWPSFPDKAHLVGAATIDTRVVSGRVHYTGCYAGVKGFRVVGWALLCDPGLFTKHTKLGECAKLRK